MKKGKFKPNGIMLAQLKEFEKEHLDWLSERICKNCKWRGCDATGSTIVCKNIKVKRSCSGIGSFYPAQDFGCNQWEKKHGS